MFLSHLQSPLHVRRLIVALERCTVNSTTGIDKQESRTFSISNLDNLNNLDSEWEEEGREGREVKEVE